MALSKHSFDLILLDLVMPSVESLEDIFEMVALAAPMPVVIVSGISDTHVIHLVRLSGATAYVPKTLPADRIALALRSVLDGVPVFMTEDEKNHPAQNVVDGESSLTPMQSKVMLLLARGKSNKEIASELALSANTIKVHVTKILRKFGVTTRAQAIALIRSRPLGQAIGAGA